MIPLAKKLNCSLKVEAKTYNLKVHILKQVHLVNLLENLLLLLVLLLIPFRSTRSMSESNDVSAVSKTLSGRGTRST